MTPYKVLSLLISGIILASCSEKKSELSLDVDDALSYCHGKISRSLTQLGGSEKDYTMMPRNIVDSDTLWNCRKAVQEEWCSGFWPGILWYDFEVTNDPEIRDEAEKYTSQLEYLATLSPYDHDLGFLINCSYGNAYRLTGDNHCREVMLEAADSLATLFNPNVGTFLSWPRNVERFGGHNTIVDNVINLELLFWASRNGGNKSLYDMAVSHADKTMENQFRPDGSCYHVAIYNPETGEFIKGMTHQGYANNSTWARGQAWAIYGYTMVFRETRDPKYRDFACKLADVYLERLPEDMVPYWDFDDPDIPECPKDASAASIVASALIELQDYCSDYHREQYRSDAEKILATLSGPAYRSADNKASFIDHATGHKPEGTEIDASIIYADYYYMEALLRLKHMQDSSASSLASLSYPLSNLSASITLQSR